MIDNWNIAGVTLDSRMLLGTARYPSLLHLEQAIQAAQCEIVTVSLRRERSGSSSGKQFFQRLQALNVRILPNTAGCRSAAEAITTAEMARDLFATNWIKLEVIGDEATLQPDPFGLIEAAEHLSAKGFVVFPYTTEDIVLAQRLLDVGCPLLMPWASPIGSAQGLRNPLALHTMRQRFPHIPLLVDAGIGRPSDAVLAMELGFDGILLNSAVALARDPVLMAKSFASAVAAGRMAYQAGYMQRRDYAEPSTPVIGQAFWHLEQNL